MLKLLDKIVFIGSVLAMAGLVGAYTSSYVNPNSFVFPSLLGLAYPYLLISNLLLLIYWTVRWKKTAWAVLIVILLGIPTFMTYYGTAYQEEKQEGHDISLLSYNIRYFDVYNWTRRSDTKDQLFRYLNRFPGDVICLQEFATKADKTQQQTIIRRLNTYPYHYIRKDMAIFSRLPIVGKGYLPFENQHSSACLYCDLALPRDTIRLYSVHLESYKLGKKERQFMKEISQGLKNTDFSEGAKNLTTRLTVANRNRARQAEQIQRHVQQSPYKIILCGDFNDTPLSYTYKEIKTDLIDAFIEKGRGLGNTYIGEFPSFRIDYILHSPSLETVSYFRDTIRLSDHYPIQGRMRIKARKE